jgi:hypothetical protein
MEGSKIGVTLRYFLDWDDALYRYQHKKEKSPDFTQYNSIFDTYLNPSSENSSHSVSYDTMLKVFTSFFSWLKVVVNAMTHYGRHYSHECTQNLEEKGVPDHEVNKFLKKASRVQEEAYGGGFTPSAIATQAGRSHRDLEAPHAAHLTVLPLVSDEIVFLLVPWLKQEKDKVDAKLKSLFNDSASFAKAKKESYELRLSSAEGSISAFIFIFSVFIVCSAARPRDEYNSILLIVLPCFRFFLRIRYLCQLFLIACKDILFTDFFS